MSYFYGETLEKQISRKYLLISQSTNNIFLSTKVKNEMQDIFHKTQRTYLALTRFANIVRHKLGKEKIDTDLRMDTINIHSKYSICIYHNNAKFFFELTDLVNIIQTAITHSQDMFPNPLWPKNPYNNLPFTTTHLYNIYFRIKFSYITMPKWIQLFFECGLHLEKFLIENEQTLRDQYIKNYVNNGPTDELYEDIQYMINKYKRIFSLTNIHDEIPKKEIVDIFRPYLYIYVTSEDAIDGTEKKRLSRMILAQKLEEFSKYNRNFGRKIVTTRCVSISFSQEADMTDPNNFISNRICNRRLVTSVTFNTSHIPFTMADAYNSFDKKKIYRPNSIIIPTTSSIHSHYHQYISNASDDDHDTSVDSGDSEVELEFLNEALVNLDNHHILQYEIEQNDTDSVS
jgi:hypothetical protein